MARSWPPSSEPLGEPCPLERVLAVGTGDLAAQARRRHDLVRVRLAFGVEGAAQLLEGVEVGLGEHLRHVALLVDADAVFAGDRAADLHAGDADLAREL